MLKELVEGVSWSPPGNASDDHFSPEFGLELANLLFALSSFVVPSPGTLPPMPGKHKFEDQLAALTPFASSRRKPASHAWEADLRPQTSLKSEV